MSFFPKKITANLSLRTPVPSFPDFFVPGGPTIPTRSPYHYWLVTTFKISTIYSQKIYSTQKIKNSHFDWIDNIVRSSSPVINWSIITALSSLLRISFSEFLYDQCRGPAELEGRRAIVPLPLNTDLKAEWTSITACQCLME